jgi:hypothetical protein
MAMPIKPLKLLKDIYNKYRDKELFLTKLKHGFALNNHGVSFKHYKKFKY